MKALRNLFTRSAGLAGSRFDRYYGDVVRSGAGYPTADEARQDLRRFDLALTRYGLLR